MYELWDSWGWLAAMLCGFVWLWWVGRKGLSPTDAEIVESRLAPSSGERLEKMAEQIADLQTRVEALERIRAR